MSQGRGIVSTTGALISLETLSDGYSFIQRLYDKILIPPSVLEEVAEGQFATPQAYLHHYKILDLIEVHNIPHQPNRPILSESGRLHESERQAIHLAVERQLPLLIEETVGRRLAREVGLSISGITGQVVAAYRQERIGEMEAWNKLSELLRAGRINAKIHEALIAGIAKL